MPNRSRANLQLLIQEEHFFSFRRWLKARDPHAVLRYEAVADRLWLLTIAFDKRYLADAAVRRWAFAR